jgi:tetratricopeptide (TPR) repeat protein
MNKTLLRWHQLKKISTMKINFIIIFSLLTVLSFGQEISLKEKAIEEFKKENYPKAIEILKSALKETPNDAEIFYYLGFFTHYNAYDSRPLAGYDASYSNIVFDYLDKALELNPNYGDATYFYSVECGAAAGREMKMGNNSSVKEYYQKAFDKGGFPEWAIEYGKSTLDLCEHNAILFTHGDFILNVCWYLQLCKSYRTDISVIPLTLLDRPWYAQKIKNNTLFTKVDLNISDEQLIDMHPYKWDTTTISLDVPKTLKEKYTLSQDYKMDWLIEPDYSSNRVVSKINSEKAKPRTFLSGQRAILVSIIETNNWSRPIYFANGFEKYFLAGLDDYLQNCGLASELLPFKTKDTEWQLNIDKLDNFVFNNKLSKLKSVLITDQPRVSGIIGSYYNLYYDLINYYKQQGKTDSIDKIIEEYQNKLLIGFRNEKEIGLLKHFKEIKKLQ